MYTEIQLEIKPKNATPRGWQKFLWYFLICLGLPTFLFGGFVLVILGIAYLFFIPRKYQKYPVTYVLTSDCLICKYPILAGIENWYISWDNIQSLYFVKINKFAPRQVGIRFKDFSGFREQMLNNTSGGVVGNFNKIFYKNKIVAKLGRSFTKFDVALPYHTMDRSAEDFVRLLSSYVTFT